MSNEKAIVPAQGQQLVISGTSVDLFGVVDQIVDQSLVTKDPHVAFGAANTLKSWGRISGLVLAKLLYQIRENWASYDTDEEFVDMAEAEAGVDKQTARKYSDIWGNVILGCPDNLRDTFRSMTIEQLWLMTPAAKAEELEQEDWENLSKCETKAEVREIIRGIRGDVTSSRTKLTIVLKRDGTLWAYKGDDVVSFGFINPKLESTVGIAARDRIIRAAGLLEE